MNNAARPATEELRVVVFTRMNVLTTSNTDSKTGRTFITNSGLLRIRLRPEAKIWRRVLSVPKATANGLETTPSSSLSR